MIRVRWFVNNDEVDDKAGAREWRVIRSAFGVCACRSTSERKIGGGDSLTEKRFENPSARRPHVSCCGHQQLINAGHLGTTRADTFARDPAAHPPRGTDQNTKDFNYVIVI